MSASIEQLPCAPLKRRGNGDRLVDSDYDVRSALMVTQYHPRSLVQAG